jgi:hypothetical protein
MADISISEVKRKAEEMDDAISGLIKAFNQETGCRVKSIYLDSDMTVGGEMIYITVKSEIELR